MGNGMQLPNLTEPKVDISEYQRCIGSLMYLMVCTRPNIAYSVGVLSRHVACPGRIHMQAVKLSQKVTYLFCDELDIVSKELRSRVRQATKDVVKSEV